MGYEITTVLLFHTGEKNQENKFSVLCNKTGYWRHLNVRQKNPLKYLSLHDVAYQGFCWGYV